MNFQSWNKFKFQADKQVENEKLHKVKVSQEQKHYNYIAWAFLWTVPVKFLNLMCDLANPKNKEVLTNLQFILDFLACSTPCTKGKQYKNSWISSITETL